MTSDPNRSTAPNLAAIEREVESHSAALKKELGLFDLVLTQVVFVVGTIWVGWHDRRDDPQNFMHVYYMDRSTDGGLTWGTDKKIGDVASLPSDFIGDYAGLAAATGLVLPMWWDSRNTSTGDPYTQMIRLHA